MAKKEKNNKKILLILLGGAVVVGGVALFATGARAQSSGSNKGCTDPTATNYNPNATQDDGSCTYQRICTPGQRTNVVLCPSKLQAKSWQECNAQGNGYFPGSQVCKSYVDITDDGTTFIHCAQSNQSRANLKITNFGDLPYSGNVTLTFKGANFQQLLNTNESINLPPGATFSKTYNFTNGKVISVDFVFSPKPSYGKHIQSFSSFSSTDNTC